MAGYLGALATSSRITRKKSLNQDDLVASLGTCDYSRVEFYSDNVHIYLVFEPELALLVGLQVMSSKEGGGREEGELSDKFFGCLSQKLK